MEGPTVDSSLHNTKVKGGSFGSAQDDKQENGSIIPVFPKGSHMCVGIPGKVVLIEGRMATVEVGGATRRIALDLLDGVALGDYIIAHAGFAIHKVDEDEALKTLEIIRELTDSIGEYEGGVC